MSAARTLIVPRPPNLYCMSANGLTLMYLKYVVDLLRVPVGHEKPVQPWMRTVRCYRR